VTDALLRDQITYYRRRVDEYDATAYGDLPVARERIDRIVSALPPAARTLELACGTGMWTQSLANRATELTAVDASPEALAIARTRSPSRVDFVCADVFSWVPDRQFDLIFFAFWLSHVPSSRLMGFFDLLERALAPAGQVVLVDEHISQAGKEALSDSEQEVAERTLSDGSTHRLVKVYIDPDGLTAQLRAMGWKSEVVVDGPDWVIATSRRIGTSPATSHQPR
jgi:ubiquinone/menaquinone biosynthesis C-methylase UbiE